MSSIVPDLAAKLRDSVAVKRISLGPDAPKRALGFIHMKNQVKMQAIDEVFVALMNVIEAAHVDKRGTTP